MITDRNAFYAFTLIGATALFGLSMATVWAQSEEADPSGQALELDKNEPIGGPFRVGFTDGGSAASATTVDNNNQTTGFGNKQTTPFGTGSGGGSGLSATTVDNNTPATGGGAFSDQDSGLSATALRNNVPTSGGGASSGGASSDRDAGASATTVDNNKPTTSGSTFFGRSSGASAANAEVSAVSAAVVEFPASGIAVFATNSVDLRKNTVLTGDVVVNDAAVFIDENGNVVPLPTLDSTNGFELVIKKDVLVNGNLTADSIAVDKNSTVTGTASFNELTKKNGVTIGAEIFPLDLPVLIAPTFREASVRSDAPNINVAAGQTVSLPTDCTLPVDPFDECPPEYGDITIAEGGILVFEGGIFNVGSIVGDDGGAQCGDINPGAPGEGTGDACQAIIFDAASDVRVDGFFELGHNVYVGPAFGSGIDASDLILYVATVNGGTGEPLSLPPAVEIGIGNTIKANFYAANGTIILNKDTIAEGAFLGRDVGLSQDTVLTENAFDFDANQAPVADPQTVVTNGAASIVIILTGSDSEGGDLTFGILGDDCPSCTGPTAGILSGLVEIVPALVEVEAPNNNVGNDVLLIGNGICDPGEDCIFIQPATTSATVTYTPGVPPDNDPDSFTFKVTDEEGAVGFATVEINPPGDPTDPPDDPVATVLVDNIVAATTVGLAVTLTLVGEAPCDNSTGVPPDPDHHPCDGVGDDTPLTFAISTGCSSPCDDPGDGVLTGLTQIVPDPVQVEVVGTGGNDDGNCDPGETCIDIFPPQRMASVIYTPTGIACNVNPATGFCFFPDSFEFEACPPISSPLLCAKGTATISVLDARPVEALPQTVATPLRTDESDPVVEITLLAIPGGEGEETQPPLALASVQAAAALLPADVAGGVADATGNGSGDNVSILTGAGATDFMAAGVGLSGEPPGSNGTARMHMAFDVSNLGDGSNLESASVVIPTHRDLLEPGLFYRFPDIVATDDTWRISICVTPSCTNSIAGDFRVGGAATGVWTGSAGTDTYTFSGTCQTNCANHGAVDGVTPITGTILLANATTGGFGIPDIVSLQITMGSYDFDFPISTPGFVSGSGSVNVAGDGLNSLLVIGQGGSSVVDNTLDTVFFTGGCLADGVCNDALDNADFETSGLAEVPNQVMTVPSLATLPRGSDGTFNLDVLAELQAALSQDRNIFTVQGRVLDEAEETGPARGLSVRTTSVNNGGNVPALSITTPGVIADPVTFLITSLPANGTLTDPVSGLISAGSLPFTLSGSQVIYMAPLEFTGFVSFGFQANDSGTGTVDAAIVGVLVQIVPLGDCEIGEQFCDDGRS